VNLVFNRILFVKIGMMPSSSFINSIVRGMGKVFFLAGLLLCAAFAAWASGITVPAGSQLKVNSSKLVVELDNDSGDINNAGEIVTTTGQIILNGNWTMQALGAYIAGAGTVDFTATVKNQQIMSGAVISDVFYHLTHSGTADLSLAGHAVNIDGDFNNLAGTFTTNSLNMFVAGNWNNISPAPVSFVSGSSTVELDGTDQEIYGSTRFYNLTKVLPVAGSHTLIFPAAKEQRIQHLLTLQGYNDTDNLRLRGSDTATHQQALLTLEATGAQSIRTVDVQDNSAANGKTLVARGGTSVNSGNLTNWQMGAVTIKWDGSEDTDWDNPFNWNLGLVPSTGDVAIIRSVDEDSGNAAIPRQPVLSSNIHLAALQVRAGASVTLDQHNITLDAALTLDGTLILDGNETVTALSLADNGSFEYYGTQNAATTITLTRNFLVNGRYLTTFNNLQINEQNPTSMADSFRTDALLTVSNGVSLDQGTFTLGAGLTLDVGHDLTVNNGTFALSGDASVTGTLVLAGGTVNALSGDLTVTGVNISGGTFLAPGPSGNFYVSGDFAHSAGTFTHNSGTVTLDGVSASAPTDQHVSGNTTFYRLDKTVPADATQLNTVTFAAGSTQTVADYLTLTGIEGNRLQIRSSSNGVAANLSLSTNAGQTIRNVDVKDNTATGLTLVARGASLNSGNTGNWVFGAATIKWDGSQSTDWNDQRNWNLGLVPLTDDTAMIRAVDEDHAGAAIVRQPVLTSGVSIANLTLRESATTLSSAGFALTVEDTLNPPGVLTSNGTIYLQGPEAVRFGQVDTDSGTFVYQGDNSGAMIDFTAGARPAVFYNLVIRDHNSTVSDFTVSHDMTVNGAFTVDGAAVISGAHTLDVTGNYHLMAGTFTAPAAGHDLQIGGNFTHSGGVFNHNNGRVVLDATSAVSATDQVISGDTTFYALIKEVPAGSTQAHQVTFDHSSTQTVSASLTLRGTAGSPLQIRSDLAGAAAGLKLSVGGLQDIKIVDVQDSNAAGGVALVARVSDDHSAPAYHTTNWIFGIPTVKWDGSVSTDWGDPSNWDMGFVPLTGDDVVIRNIDPLTVPPNQAIVHQPVLTALSGAVAPRDLSLDANTTLTLAGYGLTVSDTLTNLGNIILKGSEPLAIQTTDKWHGTFTYVGDNTGTLLLGKFDAAHPTIDYYNLVFADTGAADTFRTQNDLHVYGVLDVVSGTLDVSTGSFTMAVDGDATIGAGGAVNALNGGIDVQGSIDLYGTLSAPITGKSFTVGGSWSMEAGAVFTPNGGTVTFDGNRAALMTGNTTFYGLAFASLGGKAVTFQAGSQQTVQQGLNMAGVKDHPLILRSTSAGSPWTLTLSYINGSAVSPAVVTFVDVQDSTAAGADGTRTYILALNSTDRKVSGVTTNPGWFFADVLLLAPDNGGRTVGTAPVLIGQSVPGEALSIKDKDNNVVATTTADAFGYFRTEFTGTPLATGANTLTPYYGAVAGLSSSVTIDANPGFDQVSVITYPDPLSHVPLTGAFQTVKGKAKPNASVHVVLNNPSSALALTLPLLSAAGIGTADASGNFSIPLTVPARRGVNYISTVVNGVSSALNSFTVYTISGVVFDSTTDNKIRKARVRLYKIDSNGKKVDPVVGVDIPADQAISLETDDEGIFRYEILSSGAGQQFALESQQMGYDFPTAITDNSKLPAGRHVLVGSRGETMTLTNGIYEVDLPVDANQYLFRVEKTANKSEARIGEVVTYTVSIENLSDSNSVLSTRLNDIIPPGFKYLNGRVQLDAVPIDDPTGNRPVVFKSGTFAARQKKVMRYQLVIGAGVAPGDYENTAYLKYDNNILISNRTHSTVKVVMDPLFDAGTVFGKVFYDLNENGRQDAPDYIFEDRQEVIEGPVANVHIVTEDGTSLTTDKNGQFHIPGLIGGRHLIRIDERSLPVGAYLTTDKVQVIDVTPGMVYKVNFGVNVDNAHIVGDDVRFFEKNLKVDQSADKLKPMLNVDMFDKEILLHNDAVMRPVELRMFMNYAPFIVSWKLDILDRDTKRLVKEFTGTKYNINDPVFWDGRDNSGKFVRSDRNYTYALKVEDGKGGWDETAEKAIAFRILTDLEATALLKRTDAEKKQDEDVRAREYRAWLIAMAAVDTTSKHSIFVRGETLTIDPEETDVRQVRVLRKGELFIDIPVPERQLLTARALLNGEDVKVRPVQIILPDGDYELEVISGDKASSGGPGVKAGALAEVPAVPAPPPTEALASASAVPAIDANAPAAASKVTQYRRPLKVGEDYVTFVAMGDGKVGYNMNRGNIEPVRQTDVYQQGFYQQGKMAYYLKGKIKGKYLLTSSYDTERKQKEMFRSIKDDQYYPVYGDASQVNYDATNTQGNLYVMLEWDKSQAVWGNYAVDLNGTEFAQYSRTLYGGKVDYASVAGNPYGDARTRVVVFHAEVRQRSAHNEFLGTGGSLYYLKHQGIIVGSAKVRLEVRDAVTGQVKRTMSMKDSVDYDIDNSQGRILFWQPVAMSADTGKIISNQLLAGDPVYVVTDYEYEVKDILQESTQGVRVAQGVGSKVVVGGTYVSETQPGGNYTLKGQDVTVRVDKNTTVKAEYAETTAQDSGTFVSTDGGITFTELAVGNLASGKAYGIMQDSRLFDRLGLKSYYKWIENNFASASTSSQQGKQLSGLAMTFDVTPVTRLTASHDVQKLIAQGNLQTKMQVGAQETSTTVLQLVHEARRLRLTSEYRHQEVKSKDDVYESETNQAQNTLALQADYDLSEKTKLKAKYQMDPTGKASREGQLTTGVTRQLTDRLSATVEESVGSSGMATKVGATANITPKLALTTDYTVSRTPDGRTAQTRTTALTGKEKFGDKTSLETTYAVAQTDKGPAKSSLGVVAGTQVDIDDASVKAGVKVQADDRNVLGQGLALDASKTDKGGRTTTAGVSLDETPAAGQKTTVSLGEKGALAPGRDLVAERSVAMGNTGVDHGETYKIVQDKDGKKLETAYTRKLSENQAERSASNIFGLSGDVNDRIAANASLEQGRVQNIDGSIYNRTAIAAGLGYVEKDAEGKQRLKSSTKLEARLDRGSQNRLQALFYQDIEGKVNDEMTLSGKFQYSQTWNTSTNKVEAQYKEIMLGTAYRPIMDDRLNLFGKYSYKEDQGPAGQINSAGIEQTKMHVFAAEGAYDLNEDWQIVEKMALRIMAEKVAGFPFTTTHTWLLVNRANYRLNQDWKVGAEYRILTQQEAKDKKSGFLLEAVRSVNDNLELGVGYNFTDFVDDLTNLGYTVQGPFIRMTGKLYDRSPEERARARQKWLDHRIELYAWKMVNDEFRRVDSPVVLEMNQIYQAAQASAKAGHYAEAQKAYKDVILGTQLMYEEAANFVRKHISFEEKLYNAFSRAREYYDKGELWQAKKLWEKIVEEAERSMLQ
jgi:uncharacterized repeat protein (TIGR01451 family)